MMDIDQKRMFLLGRMVERKMGMDERSCGNARAWRRLGEEIQRLAVMRDDAIETAFQAEVSRKACEIDGVDAADGTRRGGKRRR